MTRMYDAVATTMPTVPLPDFGAMFGQGTINQTCYTRLQAIATKVQAGGVATLTQEEFTMLQQVIAGNVSSCNATEDAGFSLSSIPWWAWLIGAAGVYYIVAD